MKYKDYYATLGVPRDADADAIKTAYRKLARKFHPDVSKEANAEEQFRKWQAYETLKDPEKRATTISLEVRVWDRSLSAVTGARRTRAASSSRSTTSTSPTCSPAWQDAAEAAGHAETGPSRATTTRPRCT
jgi:curved DNA-binding protein